MLVNERASMILPIGVADPVEWIARMVQDPHDQQGKSGNAQPSLDNGSWQG